MVVKNIDYWLKCAIDSCNDIVEPYWKEHDDWVDIDYTYGPQFLAFRHPEHWDYAKEKIR